jgi:hypothetical protein
MAIAAYWTVQAEKVEQEAQQQQQIQPRKDNE